MKNKLNGSAALCLLLFSRKNFFQVQNAWCDQDLPALKNLLGPDLYAQWEKELRASMIKGEHNVMENLTLNQVRFVEVKDYKDDSHDSFSVCLDASAIDYSVNKQGEVTDSNAKNFWGGATKEKKAKAFREFWTYKRRGKNDWTLENVEQEGAWHHLVNEPLVDVE